MQESFFWRGDAGCSYAGWCYFYKVNNAGRSFCLEAGEKRYPRSAVKTHNNKKMRRTTLKVTHSEVNRRPAFYFIFYLTTAVTNATVRATFEPSKSRREAPLSRAVKAYTILIRVGISTSSPPLPTPHPSTPLPPNSPPRQKRLLWRCTPSPLRPPARRPTGPPAAAFSGLTRKTPCVRVVCRGLTKSREKQ